MKFFPDAIGRKLGEQSLFASEQAPKALFVGGVVGMVGSTVLACRATLKLEAVLDEIEHNKAQADQAKELVDAEGGTTESGQTYTDKEHRRDVTIISIRGVGNVVKLYAPAVLLGGVSIFALTKSHNILKDRNIALTAAYAAVDGAFKRYRERVIDRYGEEADRDLRYEHEVLDIVDEDTGEVVAEAHVLSAPGAAYARWYDEISSANWSPDPDINMLFLRNVQNWANDRLRARGHVFLNEVYDGLGLSHTSPGAVVGWRWNKESGDDFIDFGIWDGEHDRQKDFFNGREGAILLDFNVDGVIYDKIDQDPTPGQYR